MNTWARHQRLRPGRLPHCCAVTESRRGFRHSSLVSFKRSSGKMGRGNRPKTASSARRLPTTTLALKRTSRGLSERRVHEAEQVVARHVSQEILHSALDSSKMPSPQKTPPFRELQAAAAGAPGGQKGIFWAPRL